MKQYTTTEQTVRLVELGFEKPRYATMFWRDNKEVTEINYTIGELIEMLPEAICESKDDSYHYFLSIETDSLTWKVFYESEDEVTLCSTFGVELVDALCSMLTMLKRQGTL